MVTPTSQYYQFLYALTDTAATQDANGDWSDTDGTWALVTVCREETNGKGSVIQTVDGQSLVFGSLIQIPKGTAKINEGTRVVVTKTTLQTPANLNDADFVRNQKITGVIIAEGSVLKCDCGKLHNRVWI